MQTITRNTFKLAVALLMMMGLFGAGFNSSVAYAASCTPTVDLDLYATTGMATLFGSTTVPIWGYSNSNTPGSATLPGPILDVNVGDCVGVTLHNVDIPEATSLLFQGQAMIPDTTGVTAGNDASYVFSADSAGTFLYEAGLIANAQHQVAMGMYGALIIRPLTAGQAYDDPSTAYDSETVMVLSELDLALNSSGAPADFDMRNYLPQYFLINGKAYPGTDPLAGNPGERVLMRYVNAGLQAHAMSTLGLSQTIIAQDGEPYSYSHNVVAETIATGQTLDTLITVPASALEGDQFVLYDANMLLHNSTAAGFGGMLTSLTVGNGPPPPTDPGPTVSGLSLSPNPTDGSVNVTVSATVTDSGTTATNIQAAEFYIDGTANPANPMTADDLAFDSTSEAVTGMIPAATLMALPSGNHTIFVRGQDTNLNWGPFVSVVLNLDKTGPATTGLSLTPNPSDGFVPVDLTATGDDTATGGSNVTAAEYWVDGSDPGEGLATAMTIVPDIAGPVRDFTAVIPSGLSQGSHVVSVRSEDAFGHWGAVATINLVVGDTTDPTTSNVSADPNPTNGLVGYNTSVPAVRVFADFSDVGTGDSNIIAAEGFIDVPGATGTGFVFIANDGSFDSPTESGYGDIPLAVVRNLANGDHTIYVHAKDAANNWSAYATTTLTVDKAGPTFGPITVNPQSASRGGGTVNVTVSGTVSTTDLNFSSGAYTITDSKSNNVVNGTFTINPDGSFSFSENISRSNSGQNNPSNRRYYTFTISAVDTLGNIGTATVQFWVQ
ncbi:MAG: multicopper oxidase domain-containing protein [Anaerolineales bacterium]